MVRLGVLECRFEAPPRLGFASSTDPETWGSLETALEYTETEHADGVGFVFTDDDPIVGVDLDDCRDPETGDVDDAALDIIERLDSYTEVSPSGTGYHVLITGELPDGRNRRGSIELYDTARFFTVTGDHVERTPTHVTRRQDALTAIHREKWDEVRYADGSTYGEKTIERAITNTSEFYDPDAGDESTHASTSTGESSADARDDSERSRAYLTEKNRLLSERVDELEATLEQKTERINTLEAEIERLTDELTARDQQDGQSQDEQAATTREGSSESETQSVWGRLFGGRSE